MALCMYVDLSTVKTDGWVLVRTNCCPIISNCYADLQWNLRHKKAGWQKTTNEKLYLQFARGNQVRRFKHFLHLFFSDKNEGQGRKYSQPTIITMQYVPETSDTCWLGTSNRSSSWIWSRSLNVGKRNCMRTRHQSLATSSVGSLEPTSAAFEPFHICTSRLQNLHALKCFIWLGQKGTYSCERACLVWGSWWPASQSKIAGEGCQSQYEETSVSDGILSPHSLPKHTSIQSVVNCMVHLFSSLHWSFSACNSWPERIYLSGNMHE